MKFSILKSTLVVACSALFMIACKKEADENTPSSTKPVTKSECRLTQIETENQGNTFTNTFTYNTAKQLTEVKTTYANQTYTTRLRYNTSGNILQMDEYIGNSLAYSRLFIYENGILSEERQLDESGQPQSTYRFIYENGKLVKKSLFSSLGIGTPEKEQSYTTYTYDNEGRIQTASTYVLSGDSSSGSFILFNKITYDYHSYPVDLAYNIQTFYDIVFFGNKNMLSNMIITTYIDGIETTTEFNYTASQPNDKGFMQQVAIASTDASYEASATYTYVCD